MIANGDIVDEAAARKALRQSGAAGLMIGRGAQGRPWLLRAVADALADQASPPPPQAGALWAILSLPIMKICLTFTGLH